MLSGSNNIGDENYFLKPGIYTIECFEGYSSLDDNYKWQCRKGRWKSSPDCVGKKWLIQYYNQLKKTEQNFTLYIL